MGQVVIYSLCGWTQSVIKWVGEPNMVGVEFDLIQISSNPFKPDQAGPAPLNFQCFCKLLISAAFIRVEAAKLIWLIINYGQADESWQPKLLVYEIWIWFQSSKVKKHKIFCMFCIFLENPRRLHWIFYFIKPKVLPIDPPRQLR